jgi:hypothetical protein
MTTELGPYVAGEVPEAWRHTFTDSDGVAIAITGYSVRVSYKLSGGTQVVRTGTLVDAANGVAGYQWVEADMATAGVMRGEMTVGNAPSATRSRSLPCCVRPSVGPSRTSRGVSVG